MNDRLKCYCLAAVALAAVLCLARPGSAAYTTIWQDGFDGSLGNWTVLATYAYDTALSHGDYTGAGSAYASGTAACQMWRSLGSRPFAEGRTTAWYYDQNNGWKQGSCGVQQREILRLTEPGGSTNLFLDFGIYSAPNYTTYNWRTVGTGGITWTAGPARWAATNCNAAWIKYETTVSPGNPGATPVGTVTFTATDGGGTNSTAAQNLTTSFFTYGMGRVYLGMNLTSTTANRRWDDIRFEATIPGAPSVSVVSGASTVTWNWTRADNNMFGFDITDGSGGAVLVYPNAGWLGRSATSYTENVAGYNVGVTRRIQPWNGSLSAYTQATGYTLQALATTPTYGAVTSTSIVVNTTGPVNLTAGNSGVIFKRDGTTDLSKVQALTATATGLTPNTSYTFTARGVNGNGVQTAESSASAAKYTLAKAVIGNNLTCDKSTGTEYDWASTFTFSNPAGWGTNTHGATAYKVTAYEYKWTTSATETWATAGTGWTSGTLAIPGTGIGDYYLHVRAQNADGVWNNAESVAYGPFKCGRATIFTEGFNGNLNNWTQGTSPYTGFDYGTQVNHGTYTGAGGAYMDLVPYQYANGPANNDRMSLSYYRVDGQNGEAGPWTGASYPTPFGECIAGGYFYDFEDAHKEYAGGHSCSRIRQALSLRGMNAGFVLDNGIYYGAPLPIPPEYPGEEFGSHRSYGYRLWGPGAEAGVGADRGVNHTRWGALRWDHNPTYTYPNPDCTGTIGWVWFQTQLVPDVPSAYSSQTDPQTKFNFWRQEETRGNPVQTLSNQGVTWTYWKYGVSTVLLGSAKSEDSAGMWDDISLKANRPGDPVIAPAQAGPLPGNDPKTSITWYWTNANVGNNIFAYDLADPAGINKAPVYPMGQPGDGLLDGESDEWIQRWQTQYTEIGLTPNAPYRRKVHAYNGTLNSNYTDVSFQTKLLSGAIVGNNTGPFPDVSTYPWAQAEVDPNGAGTSGNLYFWDGYTHPEEHLAVDGTAVAPNTAHGHGPSSAWWHKHISGHIPFAFENSAIFGTSTHGGSVWKASRFKYIWNMSATPPAWSSSTPATEWSSGTINLACTDTFLPGGNPVDGKYYLHVAAMNENGEWNYTAADTATYGPFQYDHTVPNNPAIGCDDGFGAAEVHADPSPSFTLSGASDPGTVGVTASGLEATASGRYRYYWGPEPLPTGAGAPVTLSDETITGLTVPLNSEGAYYLHVQTKDEAGNWSDPITWTYNFKTPEWEFPTGAVNLAPPGVYNWDNWAEASGKHDSMVFASSNSKAHGVWGTAAISPTPGPKLKDAVQAEDIWLLAGPPGGALDLNGQVYGRLPVARLNVGSPTPAPTRTVIGGTCAPDTAQSGRVYAIEAGTRQVLWTHDIGAGYNVKAKPGGAFNKTIGSYTGDVIYAVTDRQGFNNYMRALKATDGTKLWSTDELGLTGVGPILGAPFLMPVGNQEAVYFATMDDGANLGGVYAINLATGLKLNNYWPVQVGSFKSALGTDGSFVYGVNEAGHLWKISLDGSSATDIFTLNVGASQGIYGAPCWVYPAWVAGTKWLVISSNAGYVYCIDVATTPATQKWVVSIPAPSCPIYWNGSVYVGSNNKRLYQLDVDDGSTVKTRNLPATVGDPVIDQVWNRLYLHAGDGVMYGFTLPL